MTLLRACLVAAPFLTLGISFSFQNKKHKQIPLSAADM